MYPEDSMSFVKGGETKTLSILSPVTPQVTSNVTWCTVTYVSVTERGTYSYNVTATANTDTDERSGQISVTAGSFSKTIALTQAAADGLVIGQTSYTDIPAAGQDITVQLTSNGDYKVSIDASWITQTTTRAMTSSTETFHVATNYETSARTGTITFTLGDLTQAVTVTQLAGEPADMPSDAKTLAAKIYAGINIGNTLEATSGETSWGNPAVNATYIAGLKALGFNAVRIPCAWSNHLSNESTYEIDATWLERVSEVVGYCVSNDMYAIVNIHWDNGWLEDNILAGYSEEINAKQKALWTQIANKLKGFDEHLLFAGTNEPGMNETSSNTALMTETAIKTIMAYQQTFVDAVRETGGNNSLRCLIVQAPATRIDDAVGGVYAFPDDEADSRLMVEVHYYEPYPFCLMEQDADWSATFWYWGSDNHVSGSGHNATWGEESYVTERFESLKTYYVDKGYPVIIGEYSAMKRTTSSYSDLDQDKHNASRAYWNKVVTREAKNHGCVPFYWETGTDINRANGTAKEEYAINGIMEGAAAGTYPY